jgi:hypothetical protein
MIWKYKIWLLLLGAVISVLLALSWNWILALIFGIFYLIMFPIVIYKQFMQ